MQIINPASLVRLDLPAKVRAADLSALFDSVIEQVEVLSLDCFDTLLWRKTAYPKDVFYDFQRYDVVKSLSVTAMQRIAAESEARRLRVITHGNAEVTLQEIYQVGFPSFNIHDIASLVESEINAEIEACYAFPPVVELIKKAHARGKPIIIVSNTYLVERQLRRLLQQVLPMDVYAAIGHVFCSSDYRQTKGDTLFDQVLTKMNVPARSLFHLGDNSLCDYQVPHAKGIAACQLVAFDKDVKEWQRLYSLAATFSDPSIHDKRPLLNLFAGLFATEPVILEKAESIIGYLSLGPILFAFSRYLHNEIKKLQQAGKKTKVLFLMRDAYLPFIAYKALYGESIGYPVRISRLSAIAASFKTKQDIIRYLSVNNFASRFEEVCEQLNLTDELTDRIIKMAQASNQPERTFCQLLTSDYLIEIILENSKRAREKLLRYIEKTAAIEPNDTVVLVDIGYIGRTQRVLTPVLMEELRAKEVLGRYLIAMNIPEWHRTRDGLLNPSWCDDRLMSLIAENALLLEDICSSCEASVQAYEDNGDPIASHTNITPEQRRRVEAIQAECLRFIVNAKNYLHEIDVNPSMTLLRESALFELVRRVYFPLAKEAQYYESFNHDKNEVASSGFFSFVGPEDDFASLRRQGLSFTEQHPFGLRSSHISLSLALISQKRFGFEIHLEDISFKREMITVITLLNNKPIQQIYPAVPTNDGYYALHVPIENENNQIAILFGLAYQYVQIDSAHLIPKRDFYQKTEKLFSADYTNQLTFNQMDKKGSDLFECVTKEAAVLFSPTMTLANDEVIFRIVFRPVIKQTLVT